MAIFPRPKKKPRLVLTQFQADQLGTQRLADYDVTIVPTTPPAKTPKEEHRRAA